MPSEPLALSIDRTGALYLGGAATARAELREAIRRERVHRTPRVVIAAAGEPAPEEPVAVVEPARAPLPVAALVRDEGASFSAGVGAVGARTDTIGAATVRPVVAAPPRKQEPPAEVAAVPLAALSQKPQPPPLDGVLARHYPARARSLRQSGEANVRARVEANGRVRIAIVRFESGKGFGAACRAALLESRWTPPRDARGKPVATWVSYRCRFRIE